jgi:hypothetical protein
VQLSYALDLLRGNKIDAHFPPDQKKAVEVEQKKP